MSQSTTISQAFVLGAGLGTRLRPLTDAMPKPLVPVWNAPLISFAFDHLIADLGTREIMVNTHHAAEQYQNLFPTQKYRQCDLEFRHETVLLDTAGGIDNIRDWLPQNDSFVVYNGDILTDLPLDQAAAIHLEQQNLVTLVLRSDGDNCNVAFDPANGRVTDMRNALGTNASNLYQFTGIYLVSPKFLPYLEAGKIESVVVPFLKAIEAEQGIGGAVIDAGHWSDLGNQQSYLDALSLMHSELFPRFGLQANKCRIHPDACIAATANIDQLSTIGPGAKIGEHAQIIESVIWPGATVADSATIERQTVL